VTNITVTVILVVRHQAHKWTDPSHRRHERLSRARVILAAMFCDAALILNAGARSCDLAIAEDGDLAVDTTPVTPMLLSIGLDARALDGDELPDGRTQWSANPSSLQEQRGSPGDALDGDGRFAGSRLWLLSRAKQSEETRLLTEYYASDSLFWAEDMTGDAAEIEAWWHARNMIRLRCSVAGEAITISKRIDR